LLKCVAIERISEFEIFKLKDSDARESAFCGTIKPHVPSDII